MILLAVVVLLLRLLRHCVIVLKPDGVKASVLPSAEHQGAMTGCDDRSTKVVECSAYPTLAHWPLPQLQLIGYRVYIIYTMKSLLLVALIALSAAPALAGKVRLCAAGKGASMCVPAFLPTKLSG